MSPRLRRNISGVRLSFVRGGRGEGFQIVMEHEGNRTEMPINLESPRPRRASRAGAHQPKRGLRTTKGRTQRAEG